jgi:hypothetical protein
MSGAGCSDNVQVSLQEREWLPYCLGLRFGDDGSCSVTPRLLEKRP